MEITRNTVTYTPWNVGSILRAEPETLDKRVDDLIKLRAELYRLVQCELDFIYGTVEKRLKDSGQFGR